MDNKKICQCKPHVPAFKMCDCHPVTDCSVSFCQVITVHESFSTCNINSNNAKIAYDTSFLGYIVERTVMDAHLPCGGACPVTVYRVKLAGAIPYIISTGSVTSNCGCPVSVSAEGSAMVDQVIGYTCGDEYPCLQEIGCDNVCARVNVETSRCGCSAKTNVIFNGEFKFKNIGAYTGTSSGSCGGTCGSSCGSSSCGNACTSICGGTCGTSCAGVGTCASVNTCGCGAS